MGSTSAVEGRLAEYLNALGIKCDIQRIKRGWRLEDYPDLRQVIMEVRTAVKDEQNVQHPIWEARDALEVQEPSAAQEARRAARNAWEASEARAAENVRRSRVAQHARDARRTRDDEVQSEWDLQFDYPNVANGLDEGPISLHRLAQWCLFHGGWKTWDLSVFATNYIGAGQIDDQSVQVWSKPIYDAFLAGAWKIFWATKTLYWLAKPKVYTETNERGWHRLHNASAPAMECDIEDMYVWHGVFVPEHMVMHPEQLSVAEIESEPDVEVRRVMIERYDQARYLTESGAKEIHRDDFGVLYRKEIPDDEPIVMVKVVNSTPNPDGTFKDYFLRVRPECRPLPVPGRRKRLGDPQPLTAYNAVASTFGMAGDEYILEMET
jgi:hypothetical protein